MKIATAGTGKMAKALARRWAEAGHAVCLGSRDADKARSAADEIGHGVLGATNDDAMAAADVAFWTIRGVYPTQVLDDVSPLAGKLVLDCNNSVIPEGFAFDPIETSLAESLQADVPDARVVKFVNTIAAEAFNHPADRLRTMNVTCYLAGDDPDARELAADLAEDVGLQPLDCGPLRHARLVEGLGDFVRWVMIGLDHGLYTAISTFPIPEPETAA
ncbi:MAG: NAD(P)-binding domain-containing protein [Planctomycetota bacterium]